MSDGGSSDRGGIQVISRAAAVLRAVADKPSGLSLSEIAGRLDLPRSTIQRIVGALIDEDLLASVGPRAGVALGPTLARLGASVVVDTERLVRPVLQSLSATLGETVDLSVLQQERAVFVDQVLGTARVVAASAIGEAFPLHCTANGKALLALLPVDRRDALLAGRLPRFTPASVTDRRQLAATIEQVAASGIAFDLEEHAEGVSAVGAGFVNRLGREFAVSIPVPSSRFAAKRARLEIALVAAMARIAALHP